MDLFFAILVAFLPLIVTYLTLPSEKAKRKSRRKTVLAYKIAPSKQRKIPVRKAILYVIIPIITAFLTIWQHCENDKKLTEVKEKNITDSIRHANERIQDSIRFTHKYLADSINHEEALAISKSNFDFTVGTVLSESDYLRRQNGHLLDRLTDETAALSTLMLMKETFADKLRIVFSFKKPVFPINQAMNFKFYPKKMMSSSLGDIGKKPLGVDPLFPVFQERMTVLPFATLKFKIDKEYKVEFEESPWNPARLFLYSENGSSNFAIQYEQSPSLNIAHIYAKIKSIESSVTLEKRYDFGVTKSRVEALEEQFIKQIIEASIEIPLYEPAGIWFKVNLALKSKYEIFEQQEEHSKKRYFSVKYIWQALKKDNGFTFNVVN